MIHLYLRFNGDIGNFEDYLTCIDFSAPNFECRINYCGVEIEMFTMNEFIPGISNKVYKNHQVK